MKTITRKKALELIDNSNGRFFTATFITKSRKRRTINCRISVKKHLKGGSKKYNERNYGLIIVWEPTSSYKTINLNTLKRLNIDNQKLKVK